jgi:hypothetical protein
LREGTIESLHEIRKHRRERDWWHCLGKGDDGGRGDSKHLPFGGPIEGVVRTVGRLRYQDLMGFIAALDEMMTTNVGHNFGAWDNLDIELSLKLLQLLD